MTARPEPLRHRLIREDLGFLDRAPLVVEVDLLIHASVDRVWAGVADAEAWAEWFPGLSEARYTSAAPHRAGSTRFVSVYTMRANEEVIAFEPGSRFAFAVTDINVPGYAAIVEEITLTAAGEGSTVVRYRQAAGLKAPMRFVGRLMAPVSRAVLRRGLKGLARWCESAPD